MEEIPKILETAKKLKIVVKGVAFHVGSGGVMFESYDISIRNARKIFDMAAGMGLEEMEFLDLGGGFTLNSPDSGKNFDEVAPRINNLLNELFPEPQILIVGEPGMFVAESVGYLASQIIG